MRKERHMTRSRIVSLVFIFSICSTAFLSAADETLTITTYYPSPYGVYKTLRLYPSTDATSGSSCTNKEGEMSYNSNDHALYVCSGASPTWQSAGGGGYWTRSGTLDIYNTDLGKVGIGTNDPKGKLHIIGDKAILQSAAAGDRLKLISYAAGSGASISAVNNDESAFENLMLAGTPITMVDGSVGISTDDTLNKLDVVGGDIAVDASHVFKVGTTSGATGCFATGYTPCIGGVLTIRYACFTGGLYYGTYDTPTAFGCGASGY